MTVKEVIDIAARLSDSPYEEDLLLGFLNTVEAKVCNDLSIEKRKYSKIDSTELIVDSPYDVLYQYYVISMVYFYMNETVKYTNLKVAFDEAYLEWKCKMQQKEDLVRKEWGA